jgi:hypothetical protein
MNTLQTGGIPGEVVEGVCMVGSHGSTSLLSGLSGWFIGGGSLGLCLRPAAASPVSRMDLLPPYAAEH